ncbi:MAG: DNA-binding protein [Planctomycetia bacterium]|nr:DNA-binding protein [Planctomycetia bacterium]
MSQFYTLEEAASKLNMSVDELRELAKKREVRSFQDRGVLRFKSEDIDARLSTPSGVNPETDSEDYTLNLEDTPTTNPADNNAPLVLDTGDSEEFTLTLDDSGITPPIFDTPIALYILMNPNLIPLHQVLSCLKILRLKFLNRV